MTSSPRRLALAALVLAGTCAAQPILINEVHGFGAGSSPVLPGDYLELWNQGATDYDLSGHTIRIWAGDTSVGTVVTVPCTPTRRHIIPANGFWVMQEAGVLGDALTGSLAGIHGMRGLPASWSSTSSMGCVIVAPGGNCIAYVYLRRATTALPAAPPNIVAPCTWVLGNVGTTGSGLAHIQRLTNTNTDSFADWGHDATTNVGTPGAPNTTGAATQTSIGPVTPVAPGPLAWETNSAACSFDFNGATNNGSAPIDVSVNNCATGTVPANFGSTLVGFPWDLAVGFNPGLAGPTACGPGSGGIGTANGQAINIDILDPTLFFLNGATFTTPWAANFAIPVPTAAAIPNISGQMVIIDPGHPDGVQLSALAQLHINVFSGTQTLTLTDDSTVNVVPASICGPNSLAFYGTSYTNFWVNSNGRVMFGAAGDTDLSATVAEALGDNPAVGFWTDLNPAAAPVGPVTVSTTGGLVTVAWNSTLYFGTTTPIVWNVVFDPATGTVTLNTTSIPANPAGLGGGDAQWLGISPGLAGGATNGGLTTFAPAGSGAPAAATDMIYDFWDGLVASAPGGVNRVASLSTGLASIVFTPAGSNYTWAGF